MGVAGVEKDRVPWGGQAGIRSAPQITADVCLGRITFLESPLGFGPGEGRIHQGLPVA